MNQPCLNDKIPNVCAAKFEMIARSLSKIQGHTSASLESLERLTRQIDQLSEKHSVLESRTQLLEARDRREELWRKRVWQLLAGAALVALGAFLR